MKKQPQQYLPTSLPEKIKKGPHKDQYAIAYRDEHGLQQTHFPFITSEIAWAYAMSVYAKVNELKLEPIPIETLEPGDIIINSMFGLMEVTGKAENRKTLLNNTLYGVTAKFIQPNLRNTVQVVISQAYKIPTNEDFTI